jgi:hypothetical protein
VGYFPFKPSHLINSFANHLREGIRQNPCQREHHGRNADAGRVGPVHRRVGPRLGRRVEAAGGAGAAFQPLEHDLARRVHARGVHGVAAWGWRWRRPATG